MQADVAGQIRRWLLDALEATSLYKAAAPLALESATSWLLLEFSRLVSRTRTHDKSKAFCDIYFAAPFQITITSNFRRFASTQFRL